jgi:hypothetical protein
LTAKIFFVIKVISFSNFVTGKPLINNGGAGFDEYVYPEWSRIAGWFIFVGCIIPIPIVYVINYIQEYRSIDHREVVCLFNLII